MVRPLRMLLLAAGVVAAAAFAVRAAAQPPAPGRSFSWASPTSPAPATPPAVVTAAPTPATSAGAGPLGALVPPLASLMQGLNADTQTVAQGQYSMLEELEHALRDRVDQFLNWVTGRH